MEYINQFMSTLDNRIDPPAKTHLKKVYSTLTIAVLSAAAGGYVHLYTNLYSILGGFTQLLITIGLVLALVFTPDNGKNQSQRLSYLLGIAFFSGFSMGPLIEMTLYIDTKILPTALISTAFIFGCFTISAIFADRRQYLYIGGMAASAASILLYMSILNFFFNSYLMYKSFIYLYFALMCMLVILDTVKIINLRARGDTDYIMHACMLFQDLMQIFRYLLIILTDKERSNNNKDKKKRN